MTVGRKGANIYTSGCATARAFIFINFHLLNRNTSKVTQEIPGENESPCNGTSTGFCFRTLPTKWHEATNRTSSFSLGKKIPETQRFNNHKILKKTAQNSICMRTATSYGHNIAKKNRGSSIMFPEIHSFFQFLKKTSIWTSMSLI